MAEVPVTINGVICDLYGRTITGPVKIVGSLMRTDLGVGGGPIFPPDGGGGDKPPDSGGGPGYHPEFPISGPGLPDKPGYPGYGRPHPEHPIVIPPEHPVDPPTEPPTTTPSPQWVWGYSPTVDAWLPVYVPGPGQPGPK